MAVGSVGKRKAERRDCQVKAQVLTPNGAPIDCLILNFSATGARVKLNAPAELPVRFKLFIPSRPETKLVLLRWRNGLEFGCEYSTGLADENTFYELMERVHQLELGHGPAAAPAADQATLQEMAQRIEALEAKLAEIESKPLEPREESAVDTVDADALTRRIDKVARTAEDYARRTEQFLVGRMDEAEARMRASFAPDMAERLARLEAAAETGAFETQQAPVAATTPNADPDILRRLVDLEARLTAQAPAREHIATDAVDGDAIARLRAHVDESVERVERFLYSRIADIEGQLITAPAPPSRPVDVNALQMQIHDLEKQLQQATATPDLDRFVERLSDLEVSVMELRAELPEANSGVDDEIRQRIAMIEERNSEIIATLRNLVVLLANRDPMRAAG